MSDGTAISWSDATWNPVSGCTEVSPGCAHCYAKTFAERWRGIEGHYYEHGFDVQLRPQQLEKPLTWKKPRRIFVNSMSDLFHEAIPDEYIDRVFAVMALCPQHTFQVLTKRIERALMYLTDWSARARADVQSAAIVHGQGGHMRAERVKEFVALVKYDPDYRPVWPLPNVLIGPTVENQHFADVRLPILAQIHDIGWRTMVSYEPALGPVDFEPYLASPGWRLGAIDWLICGGESGAQRRPFDLDWARAALGHARFAGVPFYMKQDSAFKSEVYDTLPDDLKVREFPL